MVKNKVMIEGRSGWIRFASGARSGPGHTAGQRVLAGLLLLLVLFNSVQAQLPEEAPKTRVCDCTTSSQFAWHAENTAMTESPFLFEGEQDVYVVNPATQDVRAYLVRREMTGSTVGIGDEFWTTEVNPSSGEPRVVDGLHSAIQAVRDFDAAVQGTIRLSGPHPPGTEPPPSIGSATDLVGIDDSSAGLNRNALNNWLTEFTATEFDKAIDSTVSGDFGDTFFEVFSGFVQALLDFLGPNSTFWIEFADGTKIKVVQQSTDVSGDPTSGGIDGVEFSYEVDQSTAQGSDLPAVPQSPGQFSGFDYSGGAVGGLGRLALRLGITLEFGGGGGDSCQGTLECSVDGDTITCTTTLSEEAIASC